MKKFFSFVFKQKDKFLVFLLVAIIGFLISLTLFYGKVDPDFFSWYYVGRGVSLGMDMFKDFAENKGPVLYFFFSFLYKVFGNNYRLALVFANWLLDTIAICFLIHLWEIWLKRKVELKNLGNLLFLLFVIFYYKSFSIGSFTGGVFSETLAIVFLLASFLFLEKGKYFLTGTLFALSVLSRQTFFLFIIFSITKIWLNNKDQQFIKVTRFLMGGIFFLVVTLCLSAYYGSLNDLVGNMVLFNSSYISVIGRGLLVNIIYISYLELRIFLTAFFTLFFLFLLLKKAELKQISWLLFLFLSSVLATLVSGIFYFHHFLQFAIFFLTLCAFLLKKNSKFLTITLTLIFIFGVTVNYYFYLNTVEEKINFIQTSKCKESLLAQNYLMIVPYVPRLYVELNRQSPDRYYQPFFLSSWYNRQADKERQKHLLLKKDKLANTVFVIGKDALSKEYLAYFEEPFGLIKKESCFINEKEFDLYVSKI